MAIIRLKNNQHRVTSSKKVTKKINVALTFSGVDGSAVSGDTKVFRDMVTDMQKELPSLSSVIFS